MDEFLPLAIQSNRLVTPPDKSQLEEVLEVDSLAYGAKMVEIDYCVLSCTPKLEFECCDEHIFCEEHLVKSPYLCLIQYCERD